MNNYAKTVAEHAKHWSAMKDVERRLMAERGRNPFFPAWGDHPRAGARWSEEENVDLELNFRNQIPESGKPLGFEELCEIAYLHGRIAASKHSSRRSSGTRSSTTSSSHGTD